MRLCKVSWNKGNHMFYPPVLFTFQARVTRWLVHMKEVHMKLASSHCPLSLSSSFFRGLACFSYLRWSERIILQWMKCKVIKHGWGNRFHMFLFMEKIDSPLPLMPIYRWVPWSVRVLFSLFAVAVLSFIGLLATFSKISDPGSLQILQTTCLQVFLANTYIWLINAKYTYETNMSLWIFQINKSEL